MRFSRLPVVVFVVLLVASGCTSTKKLGGDDSSSSSDPTESSTGESTPASNSDDTAPPGTADQPAGDLDWGECDDEQVTEPTLECATLAVPLDYDDPDGETIDIAMVRVPAQDDREGAILFNPGGPGGSGFDYIAQGGTFISAELGLENFDLIGFDPRGVDRSNGIRCLTDAEVDKYAYLDDTPDTPEEQALLDEEDVAFATACKAKYGDSLQFYSTTNTARDMDAIRAALGDDTISFLGISYGTYLGAVYATMFPDRVRALALDSAFEPTGDTIEEQYKTQLVGFEHAFDDWAEWCETNSDCAFKTDDVGGAWDELVQQLDDNPVPNADGRVGNQSVLSAATVAALYSKSEWPVLGKALADAAAGDPAGLFRLADAYAGRDEDGTYSTIGQSNTVINCASGVEGELPPDPEALAEELRAAVPRFGADITAADFDETGGCADLMPQQPIDTLSYDGDAPIVVVGGTNDPATPFRWAEEMTEAMGPSAVLVTYTGEGHGQLLASTCVTDIEANVLVDLETPPEGTVCDPDPEVEQPEWWSSLPMPDGIDPVLDAPEIEAALGLAPTQLYGEVHTSSLSPDDVLAAYKAELGDAGFEYLGQQEPIPNTKQAVYTAPNDDLFSVFTIGPDAFSDPTLEGVADLIPEGKSLVVLLYLPQ